MIRRVGIAAIIALALSSQAFAQTGTDLLQYLPDGNGVAVVDVQKLTSSELWATITSNERTRKALDTFKSELEKVGLTGAEVKTVAVAFGDQSLKSAVAAASGTFDPDKVLAAIKSNPKVKVSSETYKGFDVYTTTTGTASKDTAFAFLSSGLAVIGKSDSVRAAIDARAGERPSIAQNVKLMEALGQSPAPAAVRFALATPTSIMSAFQSSNMPLPDFSSVKMIFGTVDVTSSIDINATLRNETADQAKVIADQLNSLLAMARGFLGSSSDPKRAPIVDMLKSITISGADVDVRISATLPKDLFAGVVK